MRIAIGEFQHETNTFCPGLTGIDQFRARYWLEGDEILARCTGVRNDLGGMIAAGARLGIEIVPTFATTCEPSATIDHAAYEEIRDRLFAGIRAAGDIDAICLALHGAGSAEGIDDIEGTLLGELREAFGADIPVVVTLDLHGHTTPAMVEHANALLYCHAYPHVDSYERGEEAIDLVARIVRDEVHPVIHLTMLPMMLPPATTFSGPAKVIADRCAEWENEPGVIDCAFVHGFPHTDVPVINTAILVTTDNDPALADRVAADVVGLLVRTREDFLQRLPGATDAIALALAAETKPAIVAEVSDNPGGGGPGDGTHVLRALLEANAPETCFGFIFDPETAAQAHAAGAGHTIPVRLGAKTDGLHGDPIVADAYVKCLTDGVFRLSTPMGAGQRVSLGKMARLVIGNVDVIVGSERSQTFDHQLFLLHGIDVSQYRVVALKSQQHFRAGFDWLDATVIRADPPGLTTANLSQLPFERAPRPIWPLDPDVDFSDFLAATGG